MLKKHTLKLLALGFLPVFWGIAIYSTDLLTVSTIFELAFFALWCWVSYKAADPYRKPLYQALLLCAVTLTILTAEMGRGLIFGWGFVSAGWYMRPFVWTPHLLMYLLTGSVSPIPVCLAAGASLFIPAYIGCRMKSIV